MKKGKILLKKGKKGKILLKKDLTSCKKKIVLVLWLTDI